MLLEFTRSAAGSAACSVEVSVIRTDTFHPASITDTFRIHTFRIHYGYISSVEVSVILTDTFLI